MIYNIHLVMCQINSPRSLVKLGSLLSELLLNMGNHQEVIANNFCGHLAHWSRHHQHQSHCSTNGSLCSQLNPLKRYLI